MNFIILTEIFNFPLLSILKKGLIKMALIDKNKIIKEILMLDTYYATEEDLYDSEMIELNAVLATIDDMPTVDAVPVVYCEYCKYRTWFAPYYGCGNFESPFYKAAQEDVPIMTKPNDFCSYGKHRDSDK